MARRVAPCCPAVRNCLHLRKISAVPFKNKVLDFFKTVFPSQWPEVWIFLGFFSVYGSLATYIACQFTIIFDNRIPWDAYFSFDNRSVVLTGGGYERHPLSNYFFGWLRHFALWISGGKMNADFRIVLALASALTISLTQVQIFKYLKNIIRLPTTFAVLLCIFSGISVTSLLLSFTPETYTYTLFLLVLFNYYAALKLRKDRPIPATALTLAAVSIGGLTVTNVVKVYLPVLFEKGLFRSRKQFFGATLRVLISAAVFIILFLYRLNFQWEKVLTKAGQQYEKFSSAKNVPAWDMIWSWLFGGNILFSGFEVRDYHNMAKTFWFKAVFMEPYSSFFPYFITALIYALVFWAFFRNLKNRFSQILMLSFAVDLLIHGVMKFGLHTAYIYGGHFIFVVPLMLGWLLYSYRKNAVFLSVITGLLLVVTFFTAANNFYRFQEFFAFLELYYR